MTDVALEGHPHRGCGGRYTRRTSMVSIKVSGMHATVERARYTCDACGDAQYTVEQRDDAERAAVESIRATYGLMAPREIRKLREQTGLTPEQFGHVLYGTPRGVVAGWEKGRYLQNQDADALMRTLTDRETLERRAQKAGVVLPVPVVPGLLAPEGTAPTPDAAPALPEQDAPVEPLVSADVPHDTDAAIRS